MSYKNRLNEYKRLKSEGREVPEVLKNEFEKTVVATVKKVAKNVEKSEDK